MMTGQVDKRGHFVLAKHVVVSFHLDGIKGIELDGFNHQNVISGLDLKQSGGTYELRLHGCYGIAGAITADRVRIELEPGEPVS
jgi:hypothetical protein